MSAPMSDLSENQIKQLSEQLRKDIDSYCKQTLDESFRNHLGASEIGHKCRRFLFFKFRWCFKSKADGRMLRLWDRGHIEEERFIKWLEGIGCVLIREREQILHYHEESDCYFYEDFFDYGDGLCVDVSHIPEHVEEAKKRGLFPKKCRIKISDIYGHFGGEIDCYGYLPERYNISTPVLFEFKTNCTGAGFNNLMSKGVESEKPLHYCQFNVYGNDHTLNLSHCVYLNTNKNDDYIYPEIVELKPEVNLKLREKAESIILAKELPERISEKSNYYECITCDAKDVCHNGAKVEINCRSCKHSKPVERAQWYCNKYNDTIPKDFIDKGCSEHSPIC